RIQPATKPLRNKFLSSSSRKNKGRTKFCSAKITPQIFVTFATLTLAFSAVAGVDVTSKAASKTAGRKGVDHEKITILPAND
ncbi:hypothetical protein, partial [Lacticaseibacillus paracasei]|uniref:hypothetical protein n=1 Tax=Lacticaseibacillus paracasei TaxID=1597 RepID=UPI001CDD379A